MADSRSGGRADVVGRLREVLALRRSAAKRSDAPSLYRRARNEMSRVRNDARERARAIARAVLRSNVSVLPVSAYDGEFELDGRSHITRMLLNGGFEADLLPLMEVALAAGGDVIDVGANVGLYSVFFGKRLRQGARVLAAEAAPSMIPLLRANLARNGVSDRVIVFEGAVSDVRGTARLTVSAGNEEYSSLGAVRHGAAPASSRRIEVPTEPLDSLVAANDLSPSVLKIDTEGAEGLVLSGASATLERGVVVMSEMDHRLLAGTGWSLGAMLDLLFSRGYEVFDARSGAPVHRDASAFVGEILALPKT